jgi:hypothetical protein
MGFDLRATRISSVSALARLLHGPNPSSQSRSHYVKVFEKRQFAGSSLSGIRDMSDFCRQRKLVGSKNKGFLLAP